MIRLIGYFVAFAAFVAAIVWLNNNPGFVEFDWFDYHIKTSMGLFIAAILILIVVCIMVWRLVHSIVGAPDAFGLFFSTRRRKKGYEALSKGIIAVGSGDVKTAQKQARIAAEKLNDEPLTLLLRAQTAQLEGNKQQAHQAFEKMTEQPATKMLGLRGLFVEAQRNDDDTAAKLIALDAVAHDGQSKWALNGLFDLQTAEGDWGGALNSLLMIGNLGSENAAKTKRKRAVLLTAEAMAIENTNAERALEFTLDAKNLSPELVPATLMAAKLLLNKGSVRKAHKLLEKCWRLAPHPELGALFAKQKDAEKDKAWLKRVQTFGEKAGVGKASAEAQGKVEAAVMVARVAIEQSDWSAARQALESIIIDDPSARICTLMAKIEQGELGNKGLVSEWLARAQRAPGDPVWLADGHIATQWAPISAVTGELDAYEWKLPNYNLAQVESDLAANILLEHQESELLAIENQEKAIVKVKEAAKSEIAALTSAQTDKLKAINLKAIEKKQKPEDGGDDGENQGGSGSQQVIIAEVVKTDKPKTIELAAKTEPVEAEKTTEKLQIEEKPEVDFQPAEASPQKSGDKKSAGIERPSPYSSRPVTQGDEQTLPRRPDDPGLPDDDSDSGNAAYYSDK